MLLILLDIIYLGHIRGYILVVFDIVRMNLIAQGIFMKASEIDGYLNDTRYESLDYLIHAKMIMWRESTSYAIMTIRVQSGKQGIDLLDRQGLKFREMYYEGL